MFKKQKKNKNSGCVNKQAAYTQTHTHIENVKLEILRKMKKKCHPKTNKQQQHSVSVCVLILE